MHPVFGLNGCTTEYVNLVFLYFNWTVLKQTANPIHSQVGGRGLVVAVGPGFGARRKLIITE